MGLIGIMLLGYKIGLMSYLFVIGRGEKVIGDNSIGLADY